MKKNGPARLPLEAASAALAAALPAAASLPADLRAWMGPEGERCSAGSARPSRRSFSATAGGGDGAADPGHVRQRWTRRLFEQRFGDGRVTDRIGQPVTDLGPVWSLLRSRGAQVSTADSRGGPRRWSGTRRRPAGLPVRRRVHPRLHGLGRPGAAVHRLRRHGRRPGPPRRTGRRLPAEGLPRRRPAAGAAPGAPALPGWHPDPSEPWHSQLGRALVLSRRDRPADGVVLLVCSMLFATCASWATASMVFDKQRQLLWLEQQDPAALRRMGMSEACRPAHWVWLGLTLAMTAYVLCKVPRRAGRGSEWVEGVLRQGAGKEQPSAAEVIRALQGERRWGLVWAWILTHFLSHLLMDAAWTARLRGTGAPEELQRLTTVEYLNQVAVVCRLPATTSSSGDRP